MLAALMLLPASLLANSFKITATLHGAVEGNTVYLCQAGIDDNSLWAPAVLDSTTVSGGGCVFQGTLSEPSLLLLKYFPNDNRSDLENGEAAMRPVVPLFIDGGNVTIDVHVDSLGLDFNLAMYGTYDYKNATISGSTLNDRYREYKQARTDHYNSQAQLSRDFNSRYYEDRSALTKEEVNTAIDAIDAAKAAERSFLKGFITRNGDNAAGVKALRETLSLFSKTEIERLVDALSQPMKTTPLGQATVLKADTVKASAVGAQFVDVEMADSNGQKHRLSEYLGRGNYTLLEFWASWCGPCRASIPHLKELYAQYHPQGFDIVSVSVDYDNNAWHKALDKEQMAWTQLVVTNGVEIHNQYNFFYIPYCVLIGPRGDIVETNCRDARLDRQLTNIYNK